MSGFRRGRRRKFSAPKNIINNESRMNKIVDIPSRAATSKGEWTQQQVVDALTAARDSIDPVQQEYFRSIANAYATQLASHDTQQFTENQNTQFEQGFRRFLEGRLEPHERERTLWKDAIPDGMGLSMVGVDGVAEYLGDFATQRLEFDTWIDKVEQLGPIAAGSSHKMDINALFMYYKYYLHGKPDPKNHFLADWRSFKDSRDPTKDDSALDVDREVNRNPRAKTAGYNPVEGAPDPGIVNPHVPTLIHTDYVRSVAPYEPGTDDGNHVPRNRGGKAPIPPNPKPKPLPPPPNPKPKPLPQPNNNNNNPPPQEPSPQPSEPESPQPLPPLPPPEPNNNPLPQPPDVPTDPGASGSGSHNNNPLPPPNPNNPLPPPQPNNPLPPPNNPQPQPNPPLPPGTTAPNPNPLPAPTGTNPNPLPPGTTAPNPNPLPAPTGTNPNPLPPGTTPNPNPLPAPTGTNPNPLPPGTTPNPNPLPPGETQPTPKPLPPPQNGGRWYPTIKPGESSGGGDTGGDQPDLPHPVPPGDAPKNLPAPDSGSPGDQPDLPHPVPPGDAPKNLPAPGSEAPDARDGDPEPIPTGLPSGVKGVPALTNPEEISTILGGVMSNDPGATTGNPALDAAIKLLGSQVNSAFEDSEAARAAAEKEKESIAAAAAQAQLDNEKEAEAAAFRHRQEDLDAIAAIKNLHDMLASKTKTITNLGHDVAARDKELAEKAQEMAELEDEMEAAAAANQAHEDAMRAHVKLIEESAIAEAQRHAETQARIEKEREEAIARGTKLIEDNARIEKELKEEEKERKAAEEARAQAEKEAARQKAAKKGYVRSIADIQREKDKADERARTEKAEAAQREKDVKADAARRLAELNTRLAEQAAILRSLESQKALTDVAAQAEKDKAARELESARAEAERHRTQAEEARLRAAEAAAAAAAANKVASANAILAASAQTASNSGGTDRERVERMLEQLRAAAEANAGVADAERRFREQQMAQQMETLARMEAARIKREAEAAAAAAAARDEERRRGKRRVRNGGARHRPDGTREDGFGPAKHIPTPPPPTAVPDFGQIMDDVDRDAAAGVRDTPMSDAGPAAPGPEGFDDKDRDGDLIDPPPEKPTGILGGLFGGKTFDPPVGKAPTVPPLAIKEAGEEVAGEMGSADPRDARGDTDPFVGKALGSISVAPGAFSKTLEWTGLGIQHAAETAMVMSGSDPYGRNTWTAKMNSRTFESLFPNSSTGQAAAHAFRSFISRKSDAVTKAMAIRARADLRAAYRANPVEGDNILLQRQPHWSMINASVVPFLAYVPRGDAVSPDDEFMALPDNPNLSPEENDRAHLERRLRVVQHASGDINRDIRAYNEFGLRAAAGNGQINDAHLNLPGSGTARIGQFGSDEDKLAYEDAMKAAAEQVALREADGETTYLKPYGHVPYPVLLTSKTDPDRVLRREIDQHTAVQRILQRQPSPTELNQANWREAYAENSPFAQALRGARFIAFNNIMTEHAYGDRIYEGENSALIDAITKYHAAAWSTEWSDPLSVGNEFDGPGQDPLEGTVEDGSFGGASVPPGRGFAFDGDGGSSSSGMSGLGQNGGAGDFDDGGSITVSTGSRPIDGTGQNGTFAPLPPPGFSDEPPKTPRQPPTPDEGPGTAVATTSTAVVRTGRRARGSGRPPQTPRTPQGRRRQPGSSTRVGGPVPTVKGGIGKGRASLDSAGSRRSIGSASSDDPSRLGMLARLLRMNKKGKGKGK